MKRTKQVKKGVQIGLSSLFSLRLFQDFVTSHKHGSQGKSVGRPCVVCLIQHGIATLNPTAARIFLRPAILRSNPSKMHRLKTTAYTPRAMLDK